MGSFEFDESDESEDSADARQQRLSNSGFRLDRLRELLHDNATESLRTRWAEELERVHGEILDRGLRPEAAELQRSLATELRHRNAALDRELPWRQYLAWARVCLDAVRDRSAAGLNQNARCRLPELLQRARAVAGRIDGTLMLVEALEVAHHIELRTAHPSVARVHLRHLSEWVAQAFDPRMAPPQARALRRAVEAELVRGNIEWARPHVAQLRVLVTKPGAGRIEGIALCYALQSLYEQVGDTEREAIEDELARLASRPGADQEQRWVWTQVAGRARRSGQRVLRPTLEMLRQRAYRGSDIEDIEALFERLEDELPERERIFHEHIATLNEMRCLAERPEANPTLRLRFARHWLQQGFNARRYDYGAVAGDRCAHAWAHEAMQRGDLEGQVLLGRCLSGGRGVERDRVAAADLLRRAAARGSDEADLLLRSLGVERIPWLRHRFTALQCVGWTMLAVHLFTQPLEFHPWGVLAYLGVMFGVMWARQILLRLTPRLRDDDGEDDDGDHAHAFYYVFRRQVTTFERKPWRILRVIYEDGATLAPLVWLGINPMTALAAGLLFGLAHYPQYRLRLCLCLAIAYFGVALLILPWAGLWAVATGHVIYDIIVLCQGIRWQRMVDHAEDPSRGPRSRPERS